MILFLAVLLVSVSVCAQTVWVVAPAGGQFSQISAAIAAASPNDRIEVRPGTYRGFTLSKRLEIVGEGAPRVSSAIVVTRGAGGSKMINFRTVEMTVSNVAGPLLLRSIRLDGWGSARLLINNSAPVYISDSTFIGGTLLSFLPGADDVVLIQQSEVFMHRCTVNGGGVGRLGEGFRAMQVQGGAVLIAQSSIRGGNGTSGGLSCAGTVKHGPGGAGISSINASITLVAGTSLAGGFGGSYLGGVKCKPDGAAVQGNAVRVSATSQIRGSGPITRIGAVPQLGLAPTLALGATSSATFTYPPGVAYALFVDLNHGLLPLPGITVPLYLTSSVAFLYAVSGNGNPTTAPVSMPNLLVLRGRILFFQAAAIDVAGRVRLSNPAVLEVR